MTPSSNANGKFGGRTVPIIIDVLRNDIAFRGELDPSSVDIVTPPRDGVAWANPDGSVTYVRGAVTRNAADTFYYTVKDGRGLTSNRAKVTVLADKTPAAVCRMVSRIKKTPGVLPAAEVKPAGPLLYRLMGKGRHGSISLVDPTTGRLLYTPDPAASGFRDSVTYDVVGARGATRQTAALMFESRIMTLGGAITAGLVDATRRLPPALHRTGYRQPLFDLLAADGYRVDLVGTQALGVGVAGFDADNEAHAGWTLIELAYGRRGDGTDGVYGWLDANPADIVLLQLERRHIVDGLAGVAAILDEIDRWQASPGGNPVTVVLASPVGNALGKAAWNASNAGMEAMAARRAAREAGAKGEIVVIDHPLAHPADFYSPLYPNPRGYRKMAAAWRNALIDNGLLRSCP